MVIKKLLLSLVLLGFSCQLPAMYDFPSPTPDEQANLNYHFIEAAKRGDHPRIRALLDQGANAKTTDECNRSALFWAIYNYCQTGQASYEYIIEDLIECCPVMLTVVDVSGKTPMSYIHTNSKLAEFVDYLKTSTPAIGSDYDKYLNELAMEDDDFYDTDEFMESSQSSVEDAVCAQSLTAISMQNNDNLPRLCKAYFGRDVKAAFINLIKNEKTAIKGACFVFTDRQIAQAIIKQTEQFNLETDIVVDGDQYKNNPATVKLLSRKGVDVSHNVKKFPKSTEFMHHKFFIFYNQDGRKILWNGSFNCTSNAADNNWENAMILDDTDVIEQFEQEFAELKKYTISIAAAKAMAASLGSNQVQ